MTRTLRLFLTGMVLCLVLGVNAASLHAAPLHAADNPALSDAQRDFVAAESALEHGQRIRFRHLMAKLRDYPLYPYLRYAELKRYISHARPKDIRNFREAYADTPLPARLQRNWLNSLARHRRWKEYIEHYQPSNSTAQQCRLHFSQYKLGLKQKAFDGAKKLWLAGNSQPKACDPLFTAWRKADQLSPQLAWQRITLAMNKNQAKLVHYLTRFLRPAEKEWAQLWLRVHRKPELILTHHRLKKTSPRVVQIVLHGLKRLAGRDADKALHAWQTLQERHAFGNEQTIQAERSIAMGLAKQAHPLALTWFAKSQLMNRTDPELRAWRIRAAMRLGKWKIAAAWIRTMPERERNTEVWRYWLARALEINGDKARARNLYMALSQSRSYYGFLAADRFGIPYHFDHHPLRPSAKAMRELEAVPPIRRARELLSLNRIPDARREWMHAIQSMPVEQLPLAAKLAQKWGWHDRSIITAARAESWDDLEMRFPTAHRQSVFNHARKHDLELAWVFAIIRQESAFTKDARSPKGALGLMQLMPRTARQLTQHRKTRRNIKRLLLSPEINIRFGTAYMRRLMDRLQEHAVLATAAYNAGPSRVFRWIPDGQVMSADLWVETVPFKETRGYLKRVLAYTVIYEQRLGFAPSSMRARMQPIGASTQVATQIESGGPS